MAQRSGFSLGEQYCERRSRHRDQWSQTGCQTSSSCEQASSCIWDHGENQSVSVSDGVPVAQETSNVVGAYKAAGSISLVPEDAAASYTAQGHLIH